MRAVLRFDLNDEDDKAAFDSAMNGQTSEYIIDQIYEELFRKPLKYGLGERFGLVLDTISEEQISTVIEIMGDVYNEVVENNRD